jgi:hypothetical protein
VFAVVVGRSRRVLSVRLRVCMRCSACAKMGVEQNDKIKGMKKLEKE